MFSVIYFLMQPWVILIVLLMYNASLLLGSLSILLSEGVKRRYSLRLTAYIFTITFCHKYDHRE
jgi:uncharacterized membrane protein